MNSKDERKSIKDRILKELSDNGLISEDISLNAQSSQKLKYDILKILIGMANKGIISKDELQKKLKSPTDKIDRCVYSVWFYLSIDQLLLFVDTMQSDLTSSPP